MSDIYLRPRWILDLFSRTNRDTWKQVDAVREKRRDLGNWPDWCFMPLTLFRTIITSGASAISAEQHKLVPFLGALATWRATQGIYSFDPSTFDALWKTPVTGDIPVKILYHLPEWRTRFRYPSRTYQSPPS